MTQQEKMQVQDHKLAALAILELFQGMWVARSIYTATKLGIADLLREEPKSTTALAQATGTHEPSLYRLLRALASLDIFLEIEERQFAQTVLSRALRSDIQESIYHEIILFGESWKWRPWEELDYSIRTGVTAFSRCHGMDLWEYLNQHPEAGKTFDLGMTSFSRIVNEPIARIYDFSPISTLVDVGGGHGGLLMTILKLYPTMKGILFERPSVIEGAKEHIEEELKERVELVGGDFFESLPEAADAYIVKQVTHNWDDEHCTKILKSCHRAMTSNSKLLVADRVILSKAEGTTFNKYWDLLMLVVPSGRERTETEFAQLYAASGFQLTRVIHTGTPISIIEGIPM